jgi:hypothetical protein
MIPALFPFMVLSGIMIRLRLTESFSALLYPFLHCLLRIRKNVCYALIMGFLCGFPMGARVTADLLERKLITEQEARFLLAFCNNIGPVYFCGFVLPLLERKLVWPYFFGMYGLPFLYGAWLRYGRFRREVSSGGRVSPWKLASTGELISTGKPASSAETSSAWDAVPRPAVLPRHSSARSRKPGVSLLSELDAAVSSAVQNMLLLGGYMVFFNLLNIIPHVLLRSVPSAEGLALLISPVLEITGGLNRLGTVFPLFSLLLLPFGGLSCAAQTYSMIKHTSLSMRTYLFHKLFLTLLTAAYYLGWFFLSPSTFLL